MEDRTSKKDDEAAVKEYREFVEKRARSSEYNIEARLKTLDQMAEMIVHAKRDYQKKAQPMRIFSELQRVTSLLKRYPGSWAICGGVAASIYRSSMRFTNDIDIALVDGEKFTAREIASAVIEQMGYNEMLGFVPGLVEQSSPAQALICCRPPGNEQFIGIDFLLPIFTWIPLAVGNAQSNVLDYGFACLPTITPEDLLLAKLQALSSPEPRPQDLDDIYEILKSTELNRTYIEKRATELGIEIEDAIREQLQAE